MVRPSHPPRLAPRGRRHRRMPRGRQRGAVASHSSMASAGGTLALTRDARLELPVVRQEYPVVVVEDAGFAPVTRPPSAARLTVAVAS